MKKFALLSVVVAVPLIGVVLAQPAGQDSKKKDDAHGAGQAPAGQGMPPMPPPPGEDHKWLEQLVGTWTFESQMNGEGEPMKCSGTDTVRSLGGRWVVGDFKSEMPGVGPMNAVLTIGYNTETGKYQGTWIDSLTDHLWVYVGTLDATKKILTLEAEGPNMMDPSKGSTQYRDVIEIKSADHRTLTSSVLVDGKWVEIVTAHYHKAK